MHAAKVKVAFGRDVGDVGGDASFFAELPDCGGGFGVVDGYEDHVGGVEVGGLEESVDVGYLVLGDAVGDFGVEAGEGGDDGYEGVGVETVEDAACCYLGL